ncbi:MAG: cytochrome C oxidase subunit IV family protein [Flavobacteriaceae bacterium]|nr:cytochrome C oxidase subunit IV family protein [Flavobacteriaceae bacterium]
MSHLNNISLKTTWVLLMLLVIIMSVFALKFNTHSNFWFVILGLSGLKFLLVAFQFMEMKSANGFWKVLLVLYLIIFAVIIVSIK